MEFSDNVNSEIAGAVDRAIRQYINARREKIPSFVHRYFSFKGALKLNKKALGSDLYKTPINIIWIVPYAGLAFTSFLLKKGGFRSIPAYIQKLPPGFETNVQKEVKWLVYTQLLEIPFSDDQRQSDKDVLLAEILNQPEVALLFQDELAKISAKSENPKFRSALESNLMEYAKSRIAAADLAGSIISLATGATMFSKITPGAISISGSIAAAIAQQAAISGFVLGPTLGSIYYSIFPVAAPMGLLLATSGSTLAILAVLTSFSGIVTDPIQTKLGLHQRRLNKLIDSLDKELRGIGNSRFKIKDQYIARVFDLLDLIRTAARTFI